MTAQEIFDIMIAGEIQFSVSKKTKSFVFYSVNFRGMPETIRVHISQAI